MLHNSHLLTLQWRGVGLLRFPFEVDEAGDAIGPATGRKLNYVSAASAVV